MTQDLKGLPKTIDRYQLLSLLGVGGMGRVVRAHDPKLKRDVALKLIESTPEDEEKAREVRFFFHREARATAALRHPNIIEIYDYSGPEAELPFIACELIEGETLREL
ncbi:hypothetical protein KAI87_00125, partial [Myxococcota bacterium]|nr:hypothetical protein [Myxococcota bacterium]